MCVALEAAPWHGLGKPWSAGPPGVGKGSGLGRPQGHLLPVCAAGRAAAALRPRKTSWCGRATKQRPCRRGYPGPGLPPGETLLHAARTAPLRGAPATGPGLRAPSNVASSLISCSHLGRSAKPAACASGWLRPHQEGPRPPARGALLPATAPVGLVTLKASFSCAPVQARKAKAAGWSEFREGGGLLGSWRVCVRSSTWPQLISGRVQLSRPLMTSHTTVTRTKRV
jgi:hypothetical protein